jgi:hypothetical protein
VSGQLAVEVVGLAVVDVGVHVGDELDGSGGVGGAVAGGTLLVVAGEPGGGFLEMLSEGVRLHAAEGVDVVLCELLHRRALSCRR